MRPSGLSIFFFFGILMTQTPQQIDKRTHWDLKHQCALVANSETIFTSHHNYTELELVEYLRRLRRLDPTYQIVASGFLSFQQFTHGVHLYIDDRLMFTIYNLEVKQHPDLCYWIKVNEHQRWVDVVDPAILAYMLEATPETKLNIYVNIATVYQQYLKQGPHYV